MERKDFENGLLKVASLPGGTIYMTCGGHFVVLTYEEAVCMTKLLLQALTYMQEENLKALSEIGVSTARLNSLKYTSEQELDRFKEIINE